MKLRCLTHRKRVIVTRSSRVYHREDSSECNTPFVVINRRPFQPAEVAGRSIGWQLRARRLR